MGEKIEGDLNILEAYQALLDGRSVALFYLGLGDEVVLKDHHIRQMVWRDGKNGVVPSSLTIGKVWRIIGEVE